MIPNQKLPADLAAPGVIEQATGGWGVGLRGPGHRAGRRRRDHHAQVWLAIGRFFTTLSAAGLFAALAVVLLVAGRTGDRASRT